MQHDPIAYDDSQRLLDEVAHAIATHTPLAIRGGNSKAFLSRAEAAHAVELDTRSHRGIVRYEPSELVMTARAGTPLVELTAALDAAGQMLPCEPPEFDGVATLGGAVASGLSGPRRPWAGAVRDFVLGCRLITGEAKHLRFGGEVMKNVAGYDMSRLTAGSFGCLALITEVSMKVLPKPRATHCAALDMTAAEALAELSGWRRAALPVTGACYVDGLLHVRLEGGEGAVSSARDRIGGMHVPMPFWTGLRERRLPFFDDPRPLWRLSLPNATPLMPLPGDVLLDWGGAQRWLKSDAPAAAIRAIAAAAGGHATCYTKPVSPANEDEAAGDGPFMPLAAPLARLHGELKRRLDPHGIFNPGRLYGNC
ncbi:glycolate oxidase subunit GlcE [Paraburkholderia caballeronis]|uniref:Glycolate oxidase FAD binding subunit n=1 Tax=Paraburkholderia caballeronis TaxID=416943 RepID=A0A1H7LZF9_9BURK|nr:glycolate oxidase subunit GlcE [Paraburkholderia caballeronis]PXW28647.1 glycolate oxidase FAD binding subunit [Paraburkholderia caballeronis]PXX04013.1 glycolate oxidase FAD binding subunit [Paraburkholderia caballeronis]RAK04757.1 glycolate oxidase FAD binding subunit [Paraburkholderia caballeronis]SED66420.1 glycolate oxidase FAD binding subunit [Paraburkholderia caballeronis]SEL03865.1 glycolate oxidase FAD binding subunit [Paraburkholderia caballeronis]